MAHVLRKYALSGTLLRNVSCRHFSALKRPEMTTKKTTKFQYFLVVIPASTFVLGVWQVFRWREKLELINVFEKRPKSPPVCLEDSINKLYELEYCPVEVRGTFDHSRECYVGPRSLIKSNEVQPVGSVLAAQSESGYLLVTPFRLADQSMEIMVNRGWVSKLQANSSSSVDRPVGEMEIRGLIRNTDKVDDSGTMYSGRRFLYRHVEKMAEELGTSPVFIDLCSPDTDSTNRRAPIPNQTNFQHSNNHVEYFITWFTLSAATFISWYGVIRSGPKFKFIK